MATTNIITVLCEGPHDVAFLRKILRCNGYKSSDIKKIGDYPDPYNGLLKNEFEKINISDLNIEESKRIMLPSAALESIDSHLFLYAVGGDSKKDNRQNLLTQIDSFIAKSEDEYEALPSDTKFTVLYFLDADNKGVKKRFNEIGLEIKEIFKEFDNSEFDGKPVSLFDNKLIFGAYIFKEKNKDKGKLEDILLPIMKKDNDDIFKNAEDFIDKNFDKKRVKKNFDKTKSIIGTAGQLQKSGSSNVVCIGQADYLTEKKILADEQCIEIAKFFNQFITGQK